MARIRRKIVMTGAAALILATGSGVAAASVMSPRPAGPTGPAAPARSTTAGPGGLNVTVATNTQTNIGTENDWADATCPASAPYVLSGEAVSTAGPLTASEPYNFTAGTPVTGAEVSGDVYGWRAVIPQGSQSTAANGGLTVYAVCSK